MSRIKWIDYLIHGYMFMAFLVLHFLQYLTDLLGHSMSIGIMHFKLKACVLYLRRNRLWLLLLLLVHRSIFPYKFNAFLYLLSDQNILCLQNDEWFNEIKWEEFFLFRGRIFNIYETEEANQLLNNHQSVLIMFQTKCDYRDYV